MRAPTRLRPQIVEIDVAVVVALHRRRRRKPAATALAGFVPCADVGNDAEVRDASSPRAWWYARITMSPAYSPCARRSAAGSPREKPVMSASQRFEHRMQELGGSLAVLLRRRERMDPRRTTRPRHGKHLRSCALSFIVHEPSGIIDCASERSRDWSVRDDSAASPSRSDGC